MLFIEGFLLIASIILLSFIGSYALSHRKTPGAFSLFWLMVAAVIWTLGSFFELVTSTFDDMLFWRNIQQIGVFFTPIMTVFFSIDYTGKKHLRKFGIGAFIISVTSVLLIFTNELHYLVRSGYHVVSSDVFGKVLIVDSTILGTLLVGFNFVLPLFSIVILLNYRKEVVKRYKKQVSLLILSFFITFIMTWLKMAVLTNIGFHISISTLYSPSALILFYSLFKYKIFALSPIARDKVFQIIQQGIIVVDQENVIVDINDYGDQLLNICYFGKKLFVGESIYNIFFEYPQVISMLEEEKDGGLELTILNNQTAIYLSIDSYPLFQDDKQVVGKVLIINDITDKKLYEMELKFLADTDSLTEINNRRFIQNYYQMILKKCHEKNTSLALLLIDLDEFKKVNDEYGHSNGDIVLMHFAALLKKTTRESEVIGRLGGEEFAVIIPYVNKEQAYKVAERIRRNVEKSKVVLQGDKIASYTISIGIADTENRIKSFDEILKEADVALYQAKDKSRNCTVIYKDANTYI